MNQIPEASLSEKKMKSPLRNKGKAKAKENDEKQDFISKLPDEVLCFIISKLRIDEAVRSSILCKRWRQLWRYTLHLEIDGKRMIKPLAQKQNPEKIQIPNSSLNRALKKGLNRYGLTVCLMLHRHFGDLSSCRFLHFPYSLTNGELESWVRLLMANKKGMRDLSLECELYDIGTNRYALEGFENGRMRPSFPAGIFSSLSSVEFINYSLSSSSPFEGCKNLKTLILKNIYLVDAVLNGILKNCELLEKFSLLESIGFKKLLIQNPNLKVLQLKALHVDEIEISVERLEVILLDTITYTTKGMKIYSPSLSAFHSYNNSIFGTMLAVREGKSVLPTLKILEDCYDIWDTRRSSIFQTLTNLAVDMDLNDIRESLALSFFMRLCIRLQTLEITLPVHYRSIFIRSSFWDIRAACDCVHHTLKFVCVKGFRGHTQEVEFLKHLIARATVMLRITIFCNDASREEARKLMYLPRASVNLSIILKSSPQGAAQEIIGLQNRELSYK